MRETESALEAALQFLRECRVPHTRLLPAVPTPLITLARFFSKHPNPEDRNRRLLRRWLWRGFFSGSLGSDAKTLRRAMVAVTERESESVQRLLAQVPKAASYCLPKEFDARNGPARLAALVLALRDPVVPTQDDVDPHGDVFDWLQEYEADVFSSFPEVPNSPASRFLTPGVTSARLRDQLLRWAASSTSHEALRSHLVNSEAATALKEERLDDFLRLRERAIQAAADELYLSMAEPQHHDRGPLVLEAS